MGEARRRKLARSDETTAPLSEEARLNRQRCRRDREKARAFRVPRGNVAVTVDCEAQPTLTLVFPASGFIAKLAALEPIGSVTYTTMPQQVIRLLVAAWQSGSPDDGRHLGMRAAWCVLNHPEHGEALRNKLDARLAADGNAHLTWRYGMSGLGLAVATRYVDIDHSPQHADMRLDAALGVDHPVAQLPRELVMSIDQQTRAHIHHDLGCVSDDQAAALARQDPAQSARYVQQLVDSWFNPKLNIQGEPAACKAGCSSCCWLVPDVTKGEDELLLAALLAMPDQERAETTARLHSTAAAVRSAGNGPAAFPLRCAFLGDDGGCRVYDSRPGQCRVHTSADADACHRNLENRGDVGIPHTLRGTMAQVSFATAQKMLWQDITLARPLPIAVCDLLAKRADADPVA